MIQFNLYIMIEVNKTNRMKYFHAKYYWLLSVTTITSEIQMEIPEQLSNLLRAGAILLHVSEVKQQVHLKD